jgi:hypothetical protein
MSVLKRRSRQVSFRLSDDEYERLCSYCISIGARSVSDMARSAICQLTDPDSPDGGDALIARKMRSLDLQVRQLNRKLEILSVLLENKVSVDQALRDVVLQSER